MSLGAVSKIWIFSFLDHNSKNNHVSNKTSTKVPFRFDYLSFDISYVKIGAFLLPENYVFRKTMKEKKNHCKINIFLSAH